MENISNPVSALLRKSGGYSEDELLLLEACLEFRSLKKGEVLLEKGETCSSFCFIEKGAIYQYSVDDELELRVFDLKVRNEWVVNHQSFTSRKPSTYTMQAYQETSIYKLSMDNIHSLIGKSQAFFQLGKVLEAGTAEVHALNQFASPDDKYLYLLEHKPELVRTFPLKMIASYLGITPETLSRVRNRLARDQPIS